ncbi:trimeric intracellular cation channel family protein [Longispora albida]|uniref:trimeric intracellular cation channel family protein n=1 Tax=Longispora albida TaxID=203523 RepID=UPI00036B7204|nr:TRIC cation channel family protein [Longispora albida]
MVLIFFDLLGVAVFAAAGAAAGARKRLDVFGVTVIGVVTALGGGLLRDLILHKGPPLALSDWRYLGVAVAVALAGFWLHPFLTRPRRTLIVMDAAGLGLFTVTGTLTSLDAGVPTVEAVLLGALSGFGGGILRDLLMAEIPSVLRREVYALAALAGAGLVTALDRTGFREPHWVALAAVLVFALRLIALKLPWQVPVARAQDS